MSKWFFTGIFFSLALTVASAAFFYKTPGQMQRVMMRAVAQEPVWTVQGEGILDQGKFHLDWFKRADGAEFLRIAYPPLKLLNNQWIEISGDPTLLSLFQLTKRRTTLKDLWQRVERFEFLFSALPQLSGTGTLWLDARTRLPAQATLQIAHAPQPVLVHLTFNYRDSVGGAPLSARPVSEVIAQLQEVAAAKNGKPKRLPSLKRNAPATGAFTHDFDQDGLSDALEVFYGTDAANPDTDDDTHLDGVEVEQGYNPVGEGRLNRE